MDLAAGVFFEFYYFCLPNLFLHAAGIRDDFRKRLHRPHAKRAIFVDLLRHAIFAKRAQDQYDRSYTVPGNGGEVATSIRVPVLHGTTPATTSLPSFPCAEAAHAVAALNAIGRRGVVTST